MPSLWLCGKVDYLYNVFVEVSYFKIYLSLFTPYYVTPSENINNSRVNDVLNAKVNLHSNKETQYFFSPIYAHTTY